jgi:hypothetical protein
MDYCQDNELCTALTNSTPPALALPELPFVAGPAPQDPVPDGWESSDVGNPTIRGGQRVIAADSMEVFGAGRDVFEGNDECRFVSRKAGVHFELSAGLTPPVDSHTFAKAGLMYRASLAADAPIVMVTLFPEGTCTFAVRRQAGARITETRMVTDARTRSVRLVRQGAHFEATAFDADGKPLVTQSADLLELAATKGHVGLFVLSHEAMLLSRATFTNIELQ